MTFLFSFLGSSRALYRLLWATLVLACSNSVMELLYSAVIWFSKCIFLFTCSLVCLRSALFAQLWQLIDILSDGRQQRAWSCLREWTCGHSARSGYLLLSLSVDECHDHNGASLFDEWLVNCSFARRCTNSCFRAHSFLLQLAVAHLRALFCSELRAILVEPALLSILARLQGLSPWSCSVASEAFAYSLQH